MGFFMGEAKVAFPPHHWVLGEVLHRARQAKKNKEVKSKNVNVERRAPLQLETRFWGQNYLALV